MKLFLFISLLFMFFLSIAQEPPKQDWTKYIDECKVAINGNIVKLPLTPPCKTVKKNNEKYVNVELYKNIKIALVVGEPKDYVIDKFNIDCSNQSVAIQLDKDNTVTSFAKYKKGGGTICPNNAPDPKWYWSYIELGYF